MNPLFLQTNPILVTGAAGFIGSHFVKMMLAKYPKLLIVSLDNLSYAGNLLNLGPVQNNPRHTFIEADIRDAEKIQEIVRQYKIHCIVHFAAESHVDNSIKSPRVFFETNVLGTFNLLEAARQYWQIEKSLTASECRFHHISTDEVYGSLEADEPAFTEQHPYQPNSPYSASKAGSDHIVRAYFHTYQLPVSSSNCSNNFGPNQHTEKLIPTVIKACLEQKPIPIYGNGKNIRDWLYVGDHCEAIDSILQKGRLGEVYNIGGNQEMDNITLVKQICSLMDEFRPKNAPHHNLISFVSDRKGHDKRYAINALKIERELAWVPEAAFAEKLRLTIESYIEVLSTKAKLGEAVSPV